MDLTPVKSSNIAGAEYLVGDQVMIIRYHDGALYARLDVTPSQYVGFMAAASKGQFVNAMPNRALRISKKGVMPNEPNVRATDTNGDSTPVGADSGKEAPPESVLNVLDEEADQCCRRFFGKAKEFHQVMVCPDCGTEFRPEMVGPVRHWRVKAWVAVVRPQR